MSISGWIARLIKEDRLFLLEPVFGSVAAKRSLLVSSEIQRLINGPWPTKRWEERGARLRADLESFASDGEISVCTDPHLASVEDLGLLAPAEAGIWDWRSRDPKPGLRLLGQFVEKDCLALLIPAMRSSVCDPPDFVPRGPLNDAASDAWREAIADTSKLFRALFHPYIPVPGGDIRNVLSGGYHSIRTNSS